MNKRSFQVVFALGGPGSGKGTQCSLIAKNFNFIHLSAGELLRNEQARPNSQFGNLIERIIIQGKIVPSHITISLLLNAMKNNVQKSKYFLIDGFPRNLQNYTCWKEETKSIVDCPFVLHLVCSQLEMTKRLLKRSQSSQRSDDNMNVIKKRFVTYNKDTISVIKEFQKEGKVKKVNGDGNQQQVWSQIKPIFQKLMSNKQVL